MRFWIVFLLSLPTIPTYALAQESLPIPEHSRMDTSTCVAQLQTHNFTESLSPREVDSQPIPVTFVAQSTHPSALETSSIQSQPVVAQLGTGIVIFPGFVVGLILLLLLSIWAYTRVYVVTPNNEAFVRTGGLFLKRKAVILYGGCVVLPGFHQLTRVPLREISIDVERTDKLAVRTQDYLRADMRVTFYVCISSKEEDVLTAAARLSQQGKITPENIKQALEKRADDAIRAAAKSKNLAEIDSDKLGFAQEVLNLMQHDLKKVGLTLNNIAISEIHESNTYDANNFFDAQGVKLRTETIQRAIQQKREVELVTQVTIEQKELDAQKRSLQIAQEKEEARLAQQLQIEAARAQRDREIQEAKHREAAAKERTRILQQKLVEEEEIRKKLAVQQSQIAAEIDLEEQNKQLKVTQALQKQEAEIAEITRQQTVEANAFQAKVKVAESEKLAKLAQEDVNIAVASKRRESFLAEAQRAKAEASVVTASEVEKAQRAQQLAVIAAEKDAQEQRVRQQNGVEIEAYRRKRQAEVAQEATELEAEAIRTLAIANREKALAEAEGIRAQIEAKNLISDANLTANVIGTIWPQLAERLPEVLQAIAPQPGVLGDTRIYAFPGANGNNGSGVQDINKLLLSTSGLALINTLLDEGKLGLLLDRVGQLLHPNDRVNSSWQANGSTEDPNLQTLTHLQNSPDRPA